MVLAQSRARSLHQGACRTFDSIMRKAQAIPSVNKYSSRGSVAHDGYHLFTIFLIVFKKVHDGMPPLLLQFAQKWM
jgi:hypothetical protein